MKLYRYLFIFMFISPANTEPLKLISSTDNPEKSFHVLTLQKFDELLKKYSAGKLVTEIYYRGSKEFPAIISEEGSVNMMVTGRSGVHQTINVTVVAVGNIALRVPILNFLTLPYLFPDFQSAKKLFQSDYMLTDINKIIAEKHNVRVLGWLIGGFRHMTNSKRPVKRVEDMEGLVIRTPRNRLMRDTYLALGATVTPLNWGDTFNAMKEGKVDGQENPYNVIFYSKFWNAKQKYVTNNGPFLWVGAILMNEGFYQNLSPELQDAVKKAGLEASKYE